jgi:hypothetical protein
MTDLNYIASFFQDGEPEVAHHTIGTVSTEEQITIAPYPPPAEGYIRLLYILISNPDGANAAVIQLWDEDLTVGATATARGSQTAPLMEFRVPASSQWIGAVPPEIFQAGIAVYSSVDAVNISSFYVKMTS